MKTLIDNIRRTSGIGQTEAELSIGVMLEFFAARLPSPVIGRMRDALEGRYHLTESRVKSVGLGNDH